MKSQLVWWWKSEIKVEQQKQNTSVEKTEKMRIMPSSAQTHLFDHAEYLLQEKIKEQLPESEFYEQEKQKEKKRRRNCCCCFHDITAERKCAKQIGM